MAGYMLAIGTDSHDAISVQIMLPVAVVSFPVQPFMDFDQGIVVLVSRLSES